jgi:uncharacterized surface protein with fasciclin (FAS1) repeats
MAGFLQPMESLLRPTINPPRKNTRKEKTSTFKVLVFLFWPEICILIFRQYLHSIYGRKKLKYQERALRIVVALSVTALVGSQIPMRGQTALGSVPQPDDNYPRPDGDNSGRFLGIKGLTNRNAITGIGIGLLGLGAYSTILDSRSAGAAGDGIESGLRGAILKGAGNKPIYDVLLSMPSDYSETVKLIDSADLVNLLRDDTPYTFFAPTNAAADLIPRNLRSPENKDSLIKLIKRHTVKGRYTISQLLALKDGTSLQTLSGDKAIITNRSNRDGELRINNILIGQNDIAASNGWIHPIEAPLEED